ncbi:MAG: UDP-glucose 6-dehydrogenase [SAR324 cluster bacterium]|uniref:UDP-glucose 6-dehydrogenase n=1 Tax=SAR324 cluster bacterium TaxID=2024889 RepID=A0A2A4T8R3_9DELT|nr:MAG: UDP-glucose 6-dehydrogenase [SAR324 cluster bacterium]
MKVSVFGSGYVGLVAGACFAESGNEVICVDIDQQKIERLKQGIIPIYEPGLEEMIKRNVRQQRLVFTTDAEAAVKESLFQFIAVGTPPGEDGSADLQYVLAVAETIGKYMTDSKVIVDKSTVPVGTADLVRDKIKSVLEKRGIDVEFDVVSNPEFLKEGAAIQDFMVPDRVVIGVDSPRGGTLMKELYSPFMKSEDRLLLMDVRSAEMTKYAANSMLATKISFMNEMANLCEKVGANIDQVRLGIGSDARIGHSFLFPGVGYGGSCFPKDVQALIRTGNSYDSTMDILQAVERVNQVQKSKMLDMLSKVYGEDLSGLTLGIWGLAFKPQTDDMREAPSRVIIDGLLQRGAKVIANDPEAIGEAQKIWKDQIEYRDNYYDVLPEIDGLLILTEWNDYRRPDFERIKNLMKKPIVFDGRNIFVPEKMRQRGFEYYSIGRP